MTAKSSDGSAEGAEKSEARSRTVLIADDHAPTREQVRGILEGAGYDVVAELSSGIEATERAKRLQPDICLLDINMPGDGITAARTITEKLPETIVVMLTVHRDDDHLFQALRAGARGYLIKGTDPDTMVAALDDALAGEPALSPGIAMRILEQFQLGRGRKVFVPGRGAVQLSSKEAEVLELLREGLRTDQIARRMYVAPVTVRSHIARILKKLNATDREDALRILGDDPS